MKRISLAFLLFIFVSSAIAQNYSSYALPENYPPGVKDVSYSNRLSFGIGVIKSFPTDPDIPIDEKYYFVINSSLLFHLFKPIFLYAGMEVYKSGHYWKSAAANINLIPTFELGSYKGRYSLFIGSGGTLKTFFEKKGGMLLGLGFMVRPEYKLDKKFTVGIELKHYNYLLKSKDELIFSGVVFLSYTY